MTHLRASVLITNYNYGRFLRDAIDSALAQTYPDVEVVVVDDGSTDNSREVIAAAAASPRVVPVLKANGGQGSAFNAGFPHCSGDVILLLDADDMLLPNVVERVVAALAAHPDAAKVYYALDVVDATGQPTGMRKPSRALTGGDLRQSVLDYFAYGWPPTSGNAFPRRVLERLLPMPEEPYRISADQYLGHVSPLLGPVIALPETGALYRLHGGNHVAWAAKERLDDRFLARVRASILRMRETRKEQFRLARELGLALPRPEMEKWRRDARLRLVSLKLEPDRHPLPGDTLWRAAWCGVATSLSRARNPTSRWPERVLQATWFATVAVAPQRLACSLIERYWFPRTRGLFTRVVFRRLQWLRRVAGRRRARTVCPIADAGPTK